MAKVEIFNGDSGGKIGATVENRGGTEQSALVVATRPLYVFTNAAGFFTSGEFGADLNQDGSFGGTPVDVHNGIDSTLWTATTIAGTKFTYDSTDRAYAGTKSIKVNNASTDDTFQLARGSDLDLSNYTALTMKINVDQDWGAGDTISFFGWDTATSAIVGNAITLESYFDETTFDVWATIVIPLADMGLVNQTIDAFRLQVGAKVGKGPIFYLDTIQVQETGDPIVYTVIPAKDTHLIIDEFIFSFAVPYAGTLADATMPKLPYDSFFGLTPTNGLVYQRSIIGEIQFSVTIKKLMDLTQIAGSEILSMGSDGTTSWATVRVPNAEPLVLKYSQEDFLSFTVSDDLTGFSFLRFGYNGRSEQRNQIT